VSAGRTDEELSAAVEYEVRDARITDVERINVLRRAVSGAPNAQGTPLRGVDLLRQLVYLPQAVVLVASARRLVVGAVVLALRPSVRHGGFVATVDLLVVDPEYERFGVIESLIREALKSVRNKGCVVVEAEQPEDTAERTLWEGYGFSEAGARLERVLAPMPAGRA
jgi:GNAT superfamily N-acetyltransferase